MTSGYRGIGGVESGDGGATAKRKGIQRLGTSTSHWPPRGGGFFFFLSMVGGTDPLLTHKHTNLA